MYLYFRPSPNLQVLPKELTKETITSAFQSDIGNRDTILKKILPAVGDEYFTIK